MPVTSVLDSSIHHREAGHGAPVVFLHGNPTSSHLWAEVLPRLADTGRCLAPDLIGMGRSGKPSIDYSFDDHSRYLDAWVDALDLPEIVLVGHDWGGALALDWAARHPTRVRGVALTETILKPMGWSEFPAAAHEMFRALRTEGVGEQLVLHDNVFIEQVLPATVIRPLSDLDKHTYGAPYPDPHSRRPLLAWSRAMPLDGQPADVAARVAAYDDWLLTSTTPVLLLTFAAGPGTMLTDQVLDWARRIRALTVAHSALPAGHHTPHDQPDAVAHAIREWLASSARAATP